MPDFEFVHDFEAPRVGVLLRKASFGRNFQLIDSFSSIEDDPGNRFSTFRKKSCQSIVVRAQCGSRAINICAGYRAPHALTATTKKNSDHLANLSYKYKSLLICMDSNACVSPKFDNSAKYRNGIEKTFLQKNEQISAIMSHKKLH